MNIKLIILLSLGVLTLGLLAYIAIRAWRYRHNHPKTLLTLLLMLAAGQGSAWAQNTWSVQNISGSTFTVSRTNTSVADTVLYRTVNLSAVAGTHYTAKTGTLYFGVGEPSKSVTVSELSPSSDNAYKYQTGTQRSYRFEVTDQGGFYLAHCTRSLTTGTSVPSSGLFDEKEITIYTSEVQYSDAGYDQSNNPHYINSSSYYGLTGIAPVSYYTLIGAQLRSTLSFDAKEQNNGYQYVQILINNTSTCDNRSGCNDGNPGNISLSRYMAGFDHQPSSANTTYAAYTFPVTSQLNNCNEVNNAWDNGVTNKLYTQKFNTDCRASDGRLILPLDFNTFVVRFNASGGGTDHDEWYAKYVKAHIQAVDAAAPAKLDVTFNPGRHSKGNYVYVSVAFSEIVVKTGSPTLSTNWGSLSYFSGSGSNVLTFRGIIPDGASGSLNVTGLSVNSTNTVKDLAGNSVSGSVTASNLCTLDASYAWPITYNLGGGTATNPATYTWETAAFTLNNPTREGYTFTGWTGSNGSTPQTAVTVANHSHAPLTYTANWEVITYAITYDYCLDGVSASNPATYTIETPTFTLANPNAPTGYTFAGWTGTDISTPTSDLTIARGSTGDRTYTANWNNLWGVDADHDGTTAERAYVITDTAGLDLLASLVNGSDQYNGFSGKFFKLGADIAYSYSSQWNDSESTESSNYTAIGNSSNRFRGTFDGCGHTVSGIRIYASNDYKGLFGYIVGGTVRNVTISDSRIAGRQDVGGIVGENYHGTVENCHATASVAIYDRGNSPIKHGGIVGYNDCSTSAATVSGCTSAATVSGSGDNYGGVVGKNYGSHATVSRCLSLGAAVTAGSFSGPVVGGSNNNNVTDCHYRRCTFNGNAQNDLYAVVAGTGVTLAPSDEASATYPYGGLQFYGSAILCGDTLYAPADATVSLDLGTSGGQLGYTCGFAASAGTLGGSANPYTLTLPSQDVTISATNLVDCWGIADGADGTYEHPYVITTPEGLLLLSAETNGGNSFYGNYFKLGADIDMSGVANFRPIYYFDGTFDGCRHTIGHLTVNWPDDDIGLFGDLYGTVQNVTLSEASVTGSNAVGAIADFSNGTIENCVVLNTTVTGSNHVGAIVGYYDDYLSTLTRNYYRNCTVVRNGVTATSNIGTNDGDVNDIANGIHRAVEGDLFTLDVAAGQWQAIATPLANSGSSQYLALTDLATGSYDLFGYYERDATWENTNDNNPNHLDRGYGYIYRSATGGTRTFIGLPRSGDSYNLYLDYRCSNEALRGFNLVGNPFNQPIAFSDISVADGDGAIAPGYYTLNANGTWQAHTAGTIAPGQGFLLQVTEEESGQSRAWIQFNRPNGSKGGTPSAPAGIAFTVRGNGHEDVAHLLFGEGAGLKKMAHLDAEAPSLSIPLGAHRYAIATLSDSTREVPLALQALPGEYTISVGLMGLMGEMGYCHLIDRATGADIDLLRDSTYTFHATGSDANRFTVKLSPSATHYPLSTTHFAHLDGDRLIVEGEGTLEVYDALGRRLFSREANSDLRLPTSDFSGTGVYLLRLAGQSQKIVITK